MPTGVYPRTSEIRAKLSAGQRGRKLSLETRAKISAANQRRIVSLETRAKLSVALMGHRNHLGYKHPELSEAMQGNRRVLDAPVKGECVYCGEPATTHDHMIPRGRPGWKSAENVVIACMACNFSKQDRDPAEWFAWLGLSVPDSFVALFKRGFQHA